MRQGHDAQGARALGYGLFALQICVAGGLLCWNFGALTGSELVWVALCFTMHIIRFPFQEKSKAMATSVDRTQGQERILLTCFVLTIWPLPLFYLITKGDPFDILSFANYSLPFDTMALGLTLLVVFACLFWRSHADLGRNWSPSLEMRQEHQLVANGVYKRMRHPMYAALLIYAVAQALLVQNLIAGGAVVVTFAALYLLRVPKEEEMMLGAFGDEYRAYMARTGRIFPKFS